VTTEAIEPDRALAAIASLDEETIQGFTARAATRFGRATRATARPARCGTA
jgi:hypothetical protein